MPKVTFTLGIGLVGCNHEDTFDLEDDFNFVEGEDYKSRDELEALLEDEWSEWSGNYIDGGFYLEDDE
ncbi:hypothetical protein [Oceanobacillus sp. J11TS1]|uniref:DUF7167 family protein n=1 Tax=Oceanobacillus sp. J11TS1 TaxID=2807191 RepID=UPI001AFF5A64|nr:hypothetical protein [Oceanobacillus sp. J11TS1]GIO22449.1 hypothetical protein J11TS1_10300 [Oceanobacillus sp. J11TS1]